MTLYFFHFSLRAPRSARLAFAQYSGGLATTEEGEQAAEVVGLGVVLADVLLGVSAVLGVPGGEVEGEVEIGADIGGGTALRAGVEEVELLLGGLEEWGGGFGVVAQMGADEHHGQETASERVAGELMGVEMIDVVEGGRVGKPALRGLLVVDAAAEYVDELTLEAGDELAVARLLFAVVGLGVLQVLVLDVVDTDGDRGAKELYLDGEAGAAGSVALVEDLDVASAEGCGDESHLLANLDIVE